MTTVQPHDLAAWQARLTARRAELDMRLHGIEDELDAHTERDWSESAVEREEDEVLERLGESGLAEIRMIDAALARIADGSFGTCQRCGDPISAERLDVLPYAPLCRDCAGGAK